MTQQTSTGPAVREAMDSIPAYVPGKPPAPRDGLETFKLSSNENPYPPLPGVLEAVVASAGSLNRYPDMGASRLYAAIARRLDVPESHLALGTGSVAVLYHLLQAVCADGDEVVLAWRSFEAYRSRSSSPGLEGAGGARGRCAHDLRAMADAVTERTKVVLVCTPEQPHRTGCAPRELEEFLQPRAATRAGGRGRGLRRVRRRPRGGLRSGRVPRAGQRGRAAHVLQGLRAGGAAGRLRGRAGPIAAAMRKAACRSGCRRWRRRRPLASLAPRTS
jgi:hypothetical protein